MQFWEMAGKEAPKDVPSGGMVTKEVATGGKGMVMTIVRRADKDNLQ